MDPVFLTGLILACLKILSACGLSALALVLYAAIAGSVELSVYNVGVTALAAWLLVSRIMDRLIIMDDYDEGDDSDEQP